MCACAAKATHVILYHKIVATLMSAMRVTSQLVASMPFVRTFQEAMNVLALRVITAIHSNLAKNVTALNVNVRRHISWSAGIASSLGARMEINAQAVRNAYQ